MRIRKNDTVLVIAGKDRGKRGKVRRVFLRETKALVEGVNMIKRHMRPRPTVRQTGIIEREAPIQVSNLMLICPKCNRPSRIGYRLVEDGAKLRACRQCGETID